MRFRWFIWLLLAPVASLAQYGNEWINFGQPYLKIQVAKEGIYRITGAQLQNAGFNPTASANLQLFHHGMELAIAISDGGDGVLDASDYIEFYGWKNLSGQDVELYQDGVAVNPYVNLFTDSTSFFLTEGSAGRRIPVIANTGVVTGSLNAHTREILQARSDLWSSGDGLQNLGLYTSTWDKGEGLIGNQITTNNSLDYVLEGITATKPLEGNPVLELRLVGRGSMPHAGEIYVGQSNKLVATPAFNGFDNLDLNIPLDWSDISADGKLFVKVKVIGVGGSPDRFAVAYLKVTYPEELNTGSNLSKVFTITENNIGEIQLSIEGVPPTTRVLDVQNPYNVQDFPGLTSGTRRELRIAGFQQRKLLVASEFYTPVLSKVSFRSINPAQPNYIIITHPQLRKPAGTYADPVLGYAAYRASEAGGGFDTLIVNIEQLYNQFGYGETTPLAIYRFMKYMTSVKNPEYLFLIGKALEPYYNYFKFPSRYSTYKDLVPTAGYPGSDVQFTIGLGGTTYEPAVATGRLTAMNSEQVAGYLDKIIEKESQPGELWQKQLLHLSGGIEEGEPELFRTYLEGMEAIAETDYLGGNVNAIAKKSRDLQFINIAEQVNDGVGMITFYGHSSPNTLDFDVGYVSNPVLGYSNKGKYPMMLMNGCEAGAFFLNYYIFGEDWIFTRDKGASAFLAHSSYGLQTTLKLYADTFYEVAFGDSTFIHKGIGDIQREVIRRYLSKTQVTKANLSQVQQMVLLGDPAVKILESNQCDLVLSDNLVSLEGFNGAEISALADSLALKVIIRNVGSTQRGKVRLEVKRYLQDNSALIYDTILPVTRFADTVVMVLRRGNEKPFGANRFEITIDADNLVGESNEENNLASYDYFIPVNGTRNLYPTPFAIIADATPGLIFQSTNTADQTRSYLVELDTIPDFSSPALQQISITGKVLLSKEVQLLTNKDTVAFYWRTKLAAPLEGERTDWEESSFTYIKNGTEGWAQIESGQFAFNLKDGMVLEPGATEFTFSKTRTLLDVRTFGALAGKPRDSVSVKIGGAEYNLYAQAGGGFGCRNNTLNFIAFDKRTTAPYVGLYYKWYESGAGRRLICGREPFVINSFQPSDMATGNGDDITAYINAISSGDSVLLFSIGNAGLPSWPVNAITKLQEIGISAAQLSAYGPNDPIIILGQKGALPGSARVYYGGSNAASEPLKISSGITGTIVSGTLTTEPIGPSSEWKRLVFNLGSRETSDSTGATLYGLSLSGEKTPLFVIAEGETSLTSVDATLYPYLQIGFHSSDKVILTPVQPDRWLIEYVPVPEGILLRDTDGLTLFEGDSAHIQFRFVNISTRNFIDSLAVNSTMINQDSRLSLSKSLKIKGPAAGDTTRFQLVNSTLGFSGLNDFSILVNPRISPEQTYANNEMDLQAFIKVIDDKTSPVLDLQVDGRYLKNDDYVSGFPEIKLRVFDDNKLLLKTDTVGVNLYLTKECLEEPCIATRISFTDESLTWVPQTDDEPFTVIYKPALEPGQYLLQADVSDASGNKAGDDPYSVNFIVIDSNTVNFSKPYPNPTRNEIYIDVVCPGMDTPNLESFEIVNSMGVVVYRSSSSLVTGTNTLIWAGNLPGAYFYRIAVLVAGKRYTASGKILKLD